jgi:hypothetical protein
MVRPLRVALAAGGIASCAVGVRYPQKLQDGSYQASCNAPLTSCLKTFETLCEWHGYDVIAASERRSRSDLREIPDVTIKSDARVRCRQPEPVFGGKSAPEPPAPAPPEPAAAPCPEPNGDRGAHCRELQPLPNFAPAPQSPGSRLDGPAPDRRFPRAAGATRLIRGGHDNVRQVACWHVPTGDRRPRGPKLFRSPRQAPVL